MVLIDSCVLIDVLDGDPVWERWSAARLAEAGRTGCVIDPVVLAELHGRVRLAGAIDAALRVYRIEVLSLEGSVSERAGAAFRLHRKRRGVFPAILADFLIGAHAVVLGAQLLTRDRARFASYFPELNIIAPEDEAP